LAPLKKSLNLLPAHKGEHFRLTAERFATDLEQFMFVSLVCRRKIDAINQLLRYSTEAQNAIALAHGVKIISRTRCRSSGDYARTKSVWGAD
jgi:hypothetical protein